MTPAVIEIGGKTTHPVGKRLSNFASRPFYFDGIACGGIEGLLQAFKCPDQQIQKEICILVGREAKAAGTPYNIWKIDQLLHWQGSSFARSSRSYTLIITRAYDELYYQDPTFGSELLELGDATIWHSIGNGNIRDTTLTESEMVGQLNRVRHKALYDKVRSTLHI